MILHAPNKQPTIMPNRRSFIRRRFLEGTAAAALAAPMAVDAMKAGKDVALEKPIHSAS